MTKGTALLILASIATIFNLSAQRIPIFERTEERNNRLSFGLQMNRFRDDFGMGVHVTSPYFWKKHMALKTSFNIANRDGILKTSPVFDWYSYCFLQAGVVITPETFFNCLRPYAGIGEILIVPNSKFSAHKTEWGEYGVMGAEFVSEPGSTYFIELGGFYSKAKAERMINEPAYFKGLSLTAGFHIYF
jgi:hypothetical protein